MSSGFIMKLGEAVAGRNDIESEIIAASIRNARQVRELAETGVDIATIPFTVIQSMISHPKTEEGMAGFVQDVVPEYRALFGQ